QSPIFITASEVLRRFTGDRVTAFSSADSIRVGHQQRESSPMKREDSLQAPVVIGLNAVIVAVTRGEPRILTVKRSEHPLPLVLSRLESLLGQGSSPADALPFGPLDATSDR